MKRLLCCFLSLLLILPAVACADVLAPDWQTAALDIIEKEKFDIVLLDVSLADGNGFAVCSAIKADSATPVIFLTGAGNRENFSKIISLGPQGYVLKSTNREGLLKILRDYLGE